jgi:predicted amidohydrolase
MSAWARKLGCYIHTGSFVEKEGEQYYNTSLLLDPAGRVAAKYRKLHLFTFKSREPEILTPGSQYSLNGEEDSHVRLSFGNLSDDQIEVGLKRMGDVLREMLKKVDISQ